ncbi:MAG: DUF1330 domain-containing protein [Burkholderiales bacterium]
MNTKSKFALAIIASAALGAATMQGLHAQAKPKAYSISELEPLDTAAAAAFAPLATAASKAAGGRSLGTGGGRVVSLDKVAAPKRVAITEWDNLEQAQAYFKSKAWTDLAPQRDKAVKEVPRYVVEVRN